MSAQPPRPPGFFGRASNAVGSVLSFLGGGADTETPKTPEELKREEEETKAKKEKERRDARGKIFQDEAIVRQNLVQEYLRQHSRKDEDEDTATTRLVEKFKKEQGENSYSQELLYVHRYYLRFITECRSLFNHPEAGLYKPPLYDSLVPVFISSSFSDEHRHVFPNHELLSRNIEPFGDEKRFVVRKDALASAFDALPIKEQLGWILSFQKNKEYNRSLTSLVGTLDTIILHYAHGLYLNEITKDKNVTFDNSIRHSRVWKKESIPSNFYHGYTHELLLSGETEYHPHHVRPGHKQRRRLTISEDEVTKWFNMLPISVKEGYINQAKKAQQAEDASRAASAQIWEADRPAREAKEKVELERELAKQREQLEALEKQLAALNRQKNDLTSKMSMNEQRLKWLQEPPLSRSQKPGSGVSPAASASASAGSPSVIRFSEESSAASKDQGRDTATPALPSALPRDAGDSKSGAAPSKKPGGKPEGKWPSGS